MTEHNHAQSVEAGFPVSFPGPFHHHDVVVSGHQVPFLRATPLDGGQVHLTLDRRLGLTLSADEAERVIPFLADAIAIFSIDPIASVTAFHRRVIMCPEGIRLVTGRLSAWRSGGRVLHSERVQMRESWSKWSRWTCEVVR
jgi:hypothetical protein